MTLQIDYYGKMAEGYDSLHKEEQLKKLRIIKDNLEIRKEDKLLDVGCGTGFSLDFFSCSCTGVEPSRDMADQCINLTAKIIIAGAEDLPFPDHSFDIVISVTAIQNFHDVGKGLDEMKRVGKDRFALSVLKRSARFPEISMMIRRKFTIRLELEEDKDIIFFT